LTLKEKIDAELITLSNREKYDEETKQIIPKTIQELIEDGITTLQEYKDIKYQEISHSYNQEFISGYFHSEVLGIDIDYRRNTTKNDLQNIEVLIEVMTDENITETEFKGYQKQKTIATLSQIKAMRKEMLLYSTTLYGKKESLENAITNAQTVEVLNSITW